METYDTVPVKAEGLCFSYGSHRVLSQAGAVFDSGKVTCLIGPNGVGKTTFLKCIARLIDPNKGMILVAGQDIRKIKLRELARLQAYVPQNSSLTFPLTVYDYICLGRKPYIAWSLQPKDLDTVEEVIRYMGLEPFREKYMDELSGGERQKVLLARALAQEPEILLLDEPTSALDICHQLEVMELIRRIAAEKNCAVILVMHDLFLVSRYADHVIMMKDGKVWASGSPGETITTENLREVYGIESVFAETEYGPILVPIRSLGGK